MDPRWTALLGAGALALGLLLGVASAGWEWPVGLVVSGGVFLALSASVWLRRRSKR